MKMKTVLITGASGGMGAASARRLLSEGYAVWGLDRREPGEIPGLKFLPVDLTRPEQIDAAVRRLSEEKIRFDAVVHMAGIYDLGSLAELPDERWERIFAVNLTAVYRLSRELLPLLGEHARIVITSSELAPLDPLPFTGLYGITKAALEKYAFSLRMELQLLGHEVVVLRPGAVDTGLLPQSTAALERFCVETKRYPGGSGRMRRIVERVETRSVSPERIAALLSRILSARRPRLVYTVNRNPMLLLLNALPDRIQLALIRALLTGGRQNKEES